MASYNLDSLMADLKRNTYTSKSAQELQREADDRYASVYAQKNLAAQQAADTAALALDRQLASLGTVSGKQREASQKAYGQTYAQANRQSGSRGMYRSSFNNTILANIAIAGNKAQQDINDQEAITRMGLEDQKTLLARHLGDQQRLNAESRISDTNAYLDQLTDREYTRDQAAIDKSNALAQQLYLYDYQNKRDQASDQQWLTQLNEGIRQFDIAQMESQRQFNENLSENRRQYDTTFTEGQRQYDNSFAENQRQYNANLDENRRQYDLSFYEGQRQYDNTMNENRRQYDMGYNENQRQYDATMLYNRDQLAENKRQYDTTQTETVRQFDVLHPPKKKSAKR